MNHFLFFWLQSALLTFGLILVTGYEPKGNLAVFLFVLALPVFIVAYILFALRTMAFWLIAPFRYW